MSDPLDDFLDRSVPCQPDNALQVELRTQTTRLLRKRRRLRKLARAGLMAACFLAGMATMYAMVPRSVAPAETSREFPVAAVPKAEPAPAIEQPPQSARTIELAARAEPDRKAAKLRQAGDLYLQEDQDYAAALRCYTQALNAGDDQALAFSPDDTWLEMALKDARRKEKARAQ